MGANFYCSPFCVPLSPFTFISSHTHHSYFFVIFLSGAFTNIQQHQLKLTELPSSNNINYKQSPLVPAREERSFAANAFAAVAFEVLPTSIRGL